MEQQLNSPRPPRSHDIYQLWLKHRVLISICAAVLLVGIVLAVSFLIGRQDDGGKNHQSGMRTTTPGRADDEFARQYLQGCKDTPVTFTQPPVAFDQMAYLEPLGKMSDGHVTPTDHVYISPLDARAADNTTDVVMPADGIVTSIQTMPAQYIGDRDQQAAPEDHRLIVAHNCRYVSIFIHVHQLSEKLAAAAGDMQPNQQKQTSVALKAGEKLGKIGGNPVDWSLMDATTKLTGYTTPDLYKREPWKIHVIDPISVYSGETKKQLIAKSLRTTEPYGGKIDYDQKGKLIGNWFREGTNGYSGSDQQRYWDGHLSVVPDYIDPSTTVVSLGNWQGKARQLAVAAGAPAPNTIDKNSGAVKYELRDLSYVDPATGAVLQGTLVRGAKIAQSTESVGTVVLQVLDGEKLKVEAFPGKRAADITGFTAAAATYMR